MAIRESLRRFSRLYTVSIFFLGSAILLSSSVAAAGGLLEATAPAQIPQFARSGPHGATAHPQDQTFSLRHVYHRGVSKHPDLLRRLDVDAADIRNLNADAITARGWGSIGPFQTSSSPIHLDRLRERGVKGIEAYYRLQESSGRRDEAWAIEEVRAPDVKNKSTVVNLSLMAANAYDETRDASEWEDVGRPFNLSSSFGWQNDGLRGHVFADETNSTIVIAIKGTSVALFDLGGTTTNDKENDNLFAGCCCGQGTFALRSVCDCSPATYTCNELCVSKEMRGPNRYYAAAIELYGNITELYPNAQVWLTGHSLGGLVASLLGMTFGHPSVTFEAIPQALAASRLDLPKPPGRSRTYAGVWNFGHTADPIFMGICNGPTSLCQFAGYAMESQCHAGLRCVYDVVGDAGWRVALATHSIRSSIRDVYRAYDVPSCVTDTECVDCLEWKRNRNNDTTTGIPSSSSTSTKTGTRTETCKTPGWFGCWDESTTSWTTTRTSTTIITETSCKSYGWFGQCYDPITTTYSSRTTVYAATTTDSLNAPSWTVADQASSSRSATSMPLITAAPKLDL